MIFTVEHQEFFWQTIANWLRITILKHVLHELTVGTNVTIQNTKDKRWDHTAAIAELLPHCEYCLQMCSSGHVCLPNRCFLKPIHDSHHIKSRENSSHMIPSPYIPSNPQITTKDPNRTMIEHPPVILPISAPIPESVAADHAPHPSASTHLVVNQPQLPNQQEFH